MNPVERVIRRIDGFQQRTPVLSFVFGVVKKYGDDNAGTLTTQLAFALFTTIFPLLLLLETGLAIVLSGNPSARQTVLHSAFAQFPIVGSELARNIHVIHRDSAFGLAIGVIGLVYGSTRLAQSGLFTMEEVWNIPGAVRPNYVTRMVRSLLFLALMGVGLLVTTFLSVYGTFSGPNLWLAVGSEGLAAATNFGLYLAAFRVLTPKQVETHCLLPGAGFGGVVWTVLQAMGGYVVGHYLRTDNAIYGLFGSVLALVAWLYIGAEVTVYAAELNTVVARRLWPRGMVQPPLTEADQRSIALQAIENQRRPEQTVVTRVWGRPMGQAEYLAAGGTVEDDVVGTEERVPDKEPPVRNGKPGGHDEEKSGPAASGAPA